MKISKRHRAYFKAAEAASELSNYERYSLGCIAVYRHTIISSGYNSHRTHPLQKKLNIHRFPEDTKHKLHAEVACLLPLIGRKDINFNEVSLYIFRRHKNGDLALARPCKSCMHLIKELGIRNIYFSNEGGYSHEHILY